MKTHYFIIESNLAVGEFEITDRALVHQIINVLKLKSGERIVLGDGDGHAYDAEIASLNTKSIHTNLLGVSNKVFEPARHVVLYCALLKKENFELVVQKATEIGIKEIVPIITDRTIKIAINFERLNKIAKEAAEQSGRAQVPEVLSPISLTQAWAELGKDDNNYFCHFGGENIMSVAVPKRANLFVGPEGGWTDNEVALAEEHGFKIVSLGGNALRGETAAIVASHILVNGLNK